MQEVFGVRLVEFTGITVLFTSSVRQRMSSWNIELLIDWLDSVLRRIGNISANGGHEKKLKKKTNWKKILPHWQLPFEYANGHNCFFTQENKMVTREKTMFKMITFVWIFKTILSPPEIFLLICTKLVFSQDLALLTFNRSTFSSISDALVLNNYTNGW